MGHLGRVDAHRLADFEARKRASFAQLLIKCGRLVHDRGLTLARERLGVPELRSAHLALLPHIPFAGVRQTSLAEALGISKQAVGPLVSELARSGVLELTSDPDDRRAKLVRFSARGLALMQDGLAILGEVEEALREVLGDTGAADLHRLLLAVHDALTADS